MNLESLLRAQERVTAAELEYASSLLTYNLAMVNLKRSNGTLLQSDNVNVSQGCEGGCKSIELSKGAPASTGYQEVITDQPSDVVPVAPIVDSFSAPMTNDNVISSARREVAPAPVITAPVRQSRAGWDYYAK